MNAAHDAVGETDEGEEADEHDGDVEGQRAAVDCASGDCADEVLFFVLLAGGHLDDACSGGDLGLGYEHF